MTADTDELKRLAEAATPGPWTADRRRHANDWTVGSSAMPVLCELRGADTTARLRVGDDALFIAAANPAAVLALLERVRRLEEALREYYTTPPEAMSLDAQTDLDRRVQRLLGLGGP